MRYLSENRFFFVCALFFILFAVLNSLYLIPYFSLANFRLHFSHFEIDQIIAMLKNFNFHKIETADDPGFIVMYALSLLLSGINKTQTFVNAVQFPLVIHLFSLIIHLGMISVIWFSESDFLQKFEKRVILIIMTSPLTLYVYSGINVYLFPMYALFLSIFLFESLLKEKQNYFRISFYSILILFCNFFRTGSAHFLFLVIILSIIIQKKEILRAYKSTSLVFVLFILSKLITSLLFSQSGHTIWHSIHAGLFEFGGCVSSTGDIYPSFIYDFNKLSHEAQGLCVPSWNDTVQYTVASIHQIKEPYSLEYDNLFKTQVIDLFRREWPLFLSLVRVRLLRAMCILPFFSHSIYGAINYEMIPFANLIGGLWIGITTAGIAVEKNRHLKYFFIGALLLAIAPALLVHSGHTAYNIPLIAIVIMIGARFAKHLFDIAKMKRSL